MIFNNNVIFVAILIYVLTLRTIELKIAKSNTEALKSQGAVEFGKSHYRFLIALHTAFFISLILEWTLSPKELNHFWPVMMSIFILANAGRFWVIRAMKGYWTTRIIIPPKGSVAGKNRMIYLLHIKYAIVVIELLALPLLFQLYWTTFFFTIMNAIVLLRIRIPEEDLAWKPKRHEGSLRSRSGLFSSGS